MAEPKPLKKPRLDISAAVVEPQVVVVVPKKPPMKNTARKTTGGYVPRFQTIGGYDKRFRPKALDDVTRKYWSVDDRGGMILRSMKNASTKPYTPPTDPVSIEEVSHTALALCSQRHTFILTRADQAQD
jgi:hypothetical protein